MAEPSIGTMSNGSKIYYDEEGNPSLTPLEIRAPLVTKYHSSLYFKWEDLSIWVVVERLTDSYESYATFRLGDSPIHACKLNWMSTRTKTETARTLGKYFKIDWDVILQQITMELVRRLKDVGDLENINQEPLSMSLNYVLDPIIPYGHPVTIYTAGGKCKSILADYITVLCQFGVPGDNDLLFLPNGQINVLYLDWESDAETHRRYIKAIKKGLKITDTEAIDYRRIEDNPIFNVADSIRSDIQRKKIGLVIIDSQMAATATNRLGASDAQISAEYYNILRSFSCATLTIDHIPKNSNIENGSEGPYGSVVKWNRARSLFFMRIDDEYDEQEHKVAALIHKKFNLGRKLKPMGLTIDFHNEGAELIDITFGTCELEDIEGYRKVVPRKTRLIDALKRLGKATIQQLAEEVGEPENVDKIGIQLANDKKTFARVAEGVYGLLSK